VNEQLWRLCLRRATNPHLRLFCFPYAGAGASAFRTWAAMTPPWLELYGLQPPGRENRIAEPLPTRLDDVAAEAEQVIRGLSGNGVPFALFGHSLGALVAYRVAQRMEMAGGLLPQHLVVSACAAPHRRGVIPAVHELPDAEFIEWLRRLGGTPNQVWAEPGLRQMLIPVLRADFRLFASFTTDGPTLLSTPITAFGGFEDRAVAYDGLAGWRELTSGAFAHFMLPGDHFFLNSSRDLLIARVLRVLTERAERNPHPVPKADRSARP
jgi:medium-chain acyl-[acyl-carrier-protein] hydrolase